MREIPQTGVFLEYHFSHTLAKVNHYHLYKYCRQKQQAIKYVAYQI